jgi:hypothetical protein
MHLGRKVKMRRKLEPISTLSDATIEELLAEVLRPLLGLLIQSGIPTSVLADGLSQSRKELEDTGGSGTPLSLGSKQRECMELLCIWRRNQEFLGNDGHPMALPISGSSGSFSRLCHFVSAIRPAEEFLETLCEFEAVRILPDGKIYPNTPTFLLANPRRDGAMAADGVLKQLAGFLRVIEYNVRQSLRGRKRRFERACTVVIAQEYVPIFERIVGERGQVFIDGLDEWLERHRSMQSPWKYTIK